MTEKNDFTFRSSDGKTMLHGISWLPEGDVRAVVQLAHGITEHVGRYDRLARFLNERGIAVYGHDCLGHGLSITANGIKGDLGDGNSWQTAVNDLYVLHNRLKADYPQVPHFFIGHSMGSFLMRSYLIRYSGTVQGAVLVGTGWKSRVLFPPALAAENLKARRALHSADERGTGLIYRTYNKHFEPGREDLTWICGDEEVVRSYEQDPLCCDWPTVHTSRELVRGILFDQRYGNLEKMDKNTPILFLSGAKDPVGDMGAGVRRTWHEFRRSGVKDCTMRLYVNKRHSILEEKDAPETVFADIGQWIEERIV